MPDNASVEPTDKSICRAMITNVMPIAMIETSAVCRPMFRKLSIERNHGDAKLNTTSRIANAIYSAYGPVALQQQLRDASHAAARRCGGLPFGRQRRDGVVHVAWPRESLRDSVDDGKVGSGDAALRRCAS